MPNLSNSLSNAVSDLDNNGDDDSAAQSFVPATKYMSLFNVVLCLLRLGFPIIITTFFYVAETRKRDVLWMQLSSIGFGLLVGAWQWFPRHW